MREATDEPRERERENISENLTQNYANIGRDCHGGERFIYYKPFSTWTGQSACCHDDTLQKKHTDFMEN